MTKSTTITNKKVIGIVGFAAIAAVLSLSMVAVSLQGQLAEAAAANKGGYATDTVEMIFDLNPSEVNPDLPTAPVEVVSYYFKSSNFNEWGVNFLAECATANHIQGKGKMQDFEGATTGIQVFFVHTDPNDNEYVVMINGETEEFDINDIDNPKYDSAKWNMCSQTFEIKTQLNALIEEVDVLDEDGNVIDTELEFVCEEFLEDGTPNPDWDTTDCQQYVELFLRNAGTHPAKVFLTNVPHGLNEVSVYAIFDADSQGLDEDRTSIAMGKRMLDLYPVIADNNNN